MLQEFFNLGYRDYPSHDNYPTRDKHSADEESNYLRGWRSHARLASTEQDSFEPNGQDVWPNY